MTISMSSLSTLGVLFLPTLALADGGYPSSVFIFEYADGTVREQRMGVYEASMTPRAGESDVLTFDTQVLILSELLEEVVVVNPGQSVSIGFQFNPLDTLGVPFDELIGHELIFNVIAPRLDFQYNIPFQITEDFAGLMAITASHTVPEDLEAGPFGVAVRNGIEGYVSINANDRAIRLVRE